MKTENTPENKAAFAAQYIGCELIVTEPASAIWYPFDKGEDCLTLVGILNNKLIVRRIAEDVRDKYDQCCLSLKPLSQITYEDAIEVAKICSHYFPINEDVECEVFINSFGRKVVSWGKSYKEKFLVEHAKDTTQGADFLRSKGYLLPWRGLSVEEIISYGWAKYEA